MNRLYSCIAAAVLVIGLLFCGCAVASESSVEIPRKQEVPEFSSSQNAGLPSCAKSDGAAVLEPPLLLTSVGESADVLMVKAILDDLGASYVLETDAKAEQLAEYQSMILVVGASTKGLSSAGRSAENELQRTQALLGGIDDDTMFVLLAHMGGSLRRGGLTDSLLELTLPHADAIVAVVGGNKDGLMSDYAESNDIPFMEAPSARGMTDLLAVLLEDEETNL